MLVRDSHLILDPAGRDSRLRTALEDLALGRFSSTRDLLRSTGADWGLWTSRSQVLALGSGAPGAVKAWLDEEPRSLDALVMWCRVLTRQAVLAWRKGDAALAAQARETARSACFRAVEVFPACPVPWLCLLDLAKLPGSLADLDPYAWHRPRDWVVPPDLLFEAGPWALLYQVEHLHPGNREALHRMREYIDARWSMTSVDFARWVASRATAGSVAYVLPLYAFVTEYQGRRAAGQETAVAYWKTGQVRHHARQARDLWFRQIPVPERERLSLLDLNHLAFVLSACGEEGVPEVFAAIGRHATAEPWSTISTSLGRTSWQAEYLMARSACRPRGHRRT